MKRLLIVLVIMFMAFSVQAKDLDMEWDTSQGATGYKIYVSADNGVTWDAGLDVGNVTAYKYLNAPETGLLLFRVGAYNSQAVVIRHDSGAWYDGTLSPPYVPGGQGIK